MSGTSSDPPILPPPHINLPSIANFRDVAHSIGSTSPSIRPKLLYRSADPSSISLASLTTMHTTLGIRTIFDLRSEPELAMSAADDLDALISSFNAAHDAAICTTCAIGPATPPRRPAVTRLWTPVFATASYTPDQLALRFAHYGSPDAAAAGFTRAYGEILGAGSQAFARVIRQLADGDAGGTLVHCTAGKDRTGVLVALVLGLLGVQERRIARDYGLTEVGLTHKRDAMVQRLAATGAFGEDEEKAIASAGRMVGAKEESMIATLNMIKERYSGGIEGYVRHVAKIDDQVIKRLIKRFLVSKDSQSVL